MSAIRVEITRWLQLIGGARFDRFDMSALDQNTNILRSRVDNKMSPQAAVIFKPIDNLSLYSAYSISYLPASGDQFSTLSDGTVILVPQKFENTEVGVKWNIQPKLPFTARSTTSTAPTSRSPTATIRDSSSPTGSTRRAASRPALTGYVTDTWQSALGYAYTDARITSATSATIVPGNRVQLVPYNQFSWWNKYQINPTWGAALGIIYFGDSFASSDDTVRLPGFVRFDTAVYLKINETWSGAAQCREHLQHRLLGLGRRQQQHLAGRRAHDQGVGKGKVLGRGFLRNSPLRPVGWVELVAKPITFSQAQQRWGSQGFNPSCKVATVN